MSEVSFSEHFTACSNMSELSGEISSSTACTTCFALRIYSLFVLSDASSHDRLIFLIGLISLADKYALSLSLGVSCISGVSGDDGGLYKENGINETLGVASGV